jgi:hypothetical protein
LFFSAGAIGAIIVLLGRFSTGNGRVSLPWIRREC